MSHLNRRIRPALIALTALSLLSSVTANAQRARPASARGRQAARRPVVRKAPAKATASPTRATPTVSLSADDLRLLVNGLELPPQARARLASDAARRKEFLKDLRELLAGADEARAAGFDARPDIRIQLDLSRAFVVARAYNQRHASQNAAAATPPQAVTSAEAEALLREPGQDAKFAEFLQDYLKNRPVSQQNTALTAAQRDELRRQWANVMVGARKGAAAGIDKERAVQLMVTYQHARLLASAYFREALAPRAKATEAEIDAYFLAHPELDPEKARAKAEEISRRARAGEDFAKLADEFTEDPSGKGRGGDLGWFGRGEMVKPFEDAAFALKPGEVSGVVETQFGYHILKLDERRAKPGGDVGAEEARARHILIRTPTPPGGAGRGRGTAHERARATIEEEKRRKLVEEIAARSRVRVAEDFQVDATPAAPAASRP